MDILNVMPYLIDALIIQPVARLVPVILFGVCAYTPDRLGVGMRHVVHKVPSVSNGPGPGIKTDIEDSGCRNLETS